jgi:hypothetical protein
MLIAIVDADAVKVNDRIIRKPNYVCRFHSFNFKTRSLPQQYQLLLKMTLSKAQIV